MSLLLTCAQVAGLLEDYEEGILPLGQFLKVKVHLYNCPECRALLATLRALPELLGRALTMEDDFQAKAQAALDGALARLAQGQGTRAWPATPVPQEAQALLDAGGDLPLRLLEEAHQLVARERPSRVHPHHLPQAVLDQLPPPFQWSWATDADGLRRAELLTDPVGGQRLSLVYAPPGSRLTPHRHLGSESLLVLEGTLKDGGVSCPIGSWLHFGPGSSHGPRIPASGCWYLVRQEGTVAFRGLGGWLRRLRRAS